MIAVDLCPIVFADLDDTLFQTAAKMMEPACETRLASVATNGKHSYMTQAQAATVAWLIETTRLIPTTARSSSALSQTTLPFRDYRICSNGGAILAADGTHDGDWASRVNSVSMAYRDVFAALKDIVERSLGETPIRSWFVEEQGVPIYFVLKVDEAADASIFDEAEERLRSEFDRTLVCHRNGRNMSFTPHGITKIDAVSALLERLPNSDMRPIWGMGDSLSDLPFMRRCQMIVTPANSQISKTLLKD